ncbi:MAG: hypothetical protein A2W61_07200 [Deltaproteobacteria bacterium RIFCSPLOWO2_01_44_7]|nr:MAG: hypothetical protein A2712_07430 [Deltaproteobacteria bacterium RIFCSPHIGHO2_01_FULL_43_49]OGQ15774.1 MAG: hypothetical protein A3D22_06220 [Deltaproteobacteria bacterium RIFCSPHIGHO2_02_FULL_44_53]OGQ28914.1 MAG: hypothetical protein A3D98_01395 [Deltaproteobacteria bacterium RIFCSPHIGHO2_12_FULL_44_21]OGQ32067.1 MAG: hypothetical protein A2979_03165 [Deltaproteobacteria bacterium RIFCSPLOWO2_01_FULL_45_74]OGQ40648.1 MAG: hypothetical protein A2W61_07200 [Deltaproteobacteria bacterium 
MKGITTIFVALLIGQVAFASPIDFSKGTLAFSAGEFEKALSFFQKTYQEDANNIDNLYFLGLTHLRLNQFSKSSYYLRELLLKKPEFSRAYFDYGLSLLREKKHSTALSWFKKAYANNPKDSEIARMATEWITRLEAGEKPTPIESREEEKIQKWSLRAATSAYYDSNVTLDPDSENLTGFQNNQDDIMGSAALDVKYLFYNTEKTKMHVGYSGYQSFYGNLFFDMNRFNYGRHRAIVSYQRKLSDNFQFRLPLDFMFVSLGKSKYMYGGGGEAAFDLAWKKNWLTTFAGKIKRDEFIAIPSNAAQVRDAVRTSFGIDQYYFFPGNRNRYLKGGYEFEMNLATGADWDYRAHKTNFTFNTPLGAGFNFLGVANIGVLRKFNHRDSIFSVKRGDFSVTGMGSLSKEIIPHLTASLSYTYAMTRSNIARFTYKRHIAGFTLATRF